MIELLAPETVQLVGAAALPVVAALDEPAAPRAVATRVRLALEHLVATPGIPFDLRAAARVALAASGDVVKGEPGSYGALLRATRTLLALVGLPVPAELSEERLYPSEVASSR